MRKVSTLFPLGVLHPEEVDGLVEALAERCRWLPVVLLYLHGAHAKGTQGVLSDLDLAVLLEPRKGRDRHTWVDVASALEEVCGRDDVDLVLLNTAGPIITDRVVRHGRLVYAAIDHQILFRVLHEDLVDLEAFAVAVARLADEGRAVCDGPRGGLTVQGWPSKGASCPIIPRHAVRCESDPLGL